MCRKACKYNPAASKSLLPLRGLYQLTGYQASLLRRVRPSACAHGATLARARNGSFRTAAPNTADQSSGRGHHGLHSQIQHVQDPGCREVWLNSHHDDRYTVLHHSYRSRPVDPTTPRPLVFLYSLFHTSAQVSSTRLRNLFLSTMRYLVSSFMLGVEFFGTVGTGRETRKEFGQSTNRSVLRWRKTKKL